jgi:uncharacterized HhH-GPD family protein
MTALPLRVTGDDNADRLLADDPFALILGMLLDQQVPMEWAFSSPLVIKARLGTLDPAGFVAKGPDVVLEAFVEKPAVHRYPASMAKRASDLAQHIVDDYGGDPAAIWETAADAGELFTRIQALPGFGPDKSKIFLALLAKRFGRAPEGWQAYAGPFGDDTPRSVADITGPDALLEVRAYKQMMKAKGKDKQGQPIKKAAKKVPAKRAAKKASSTS